MKVEKEKEAYTYIENEKDNITKVESDTNQSTYFKQTIINKSQMMRILGQEGSIIIQDEQGEIIQEITQNAEEDENGNIVINYNEKEVKDIKIVTTEAIQIGELEIKNKKAISSNIGYSKPEIEKLEILETTIKVNEAKYILQMKLLDTKSEAKITMERKTLSALTKNEDVQIIVTLLSDSNQYDLYKNPIIELVFPHELNVNIKNIKQLNFEEQLQIKESKLQETENEKIVKIILEGEQQNYIQNINQGIQISIIADIEIPITTYLKESNITLSMTNENRSEIFRTEQPINIKTKYGVLMVNNLTNYNEVQETIQTIDNQEKILSIDAYSNEKIAIGNIQIMNNYEQNISEISMIGTITEQEQKMGIRFQEVKLEQNFNAKIYYSDKANLDKDSTQWEENIEELKEIKAYKIVINDEIPSGENIKILYSLHIPENINTGAKSYMKNTLEYKYLNHEEIAVSNIKCTTKNQQSNMFLASKETEETEQLKVEISAMSGNQFLEDGDIVKEGQGIRYKIRLTNQSDKDLTNIQLEAINANAIYYELIAYEEMVDFAPYTKYKVEENEALTSKKLEIDLLKSGETKEVSYQISVKQVEDNNQTLTGEIRIRADNQEEKTIQNVSNKIEKSEIKATLKFLYSQDVITYEGSGVPLMARIKNISENKLQNLIVEMPLADQFNDFTENDIILTGEEPFEILEYKDRILKFKIPEIEGNQTIDIIVKLSVGKIDLNKTVDTISQYFKVVKGQTEYISNDIEKEVEQSSVEIVAQQTTNKEGRKIKNGEQIKFFITIQNKGVIEKDISITDKIPGGLRIKSAKVKMNEIEKEMDCSTRLLVEEVSIKPDEIIQLEIDTVVDTETMQEQEIENYVEIIGINVSAQSNKVSFFIELDPEDEGNEGDNNGDNDNKDDENKDDPNKNHTYNISGVAWLDQNKNGRKDLEEAKISNMPVFLMNEEAKVEVSQKTKEDGSYLFENLKPGNYIVVFQYDTNKYAVTTYQKEEVKQDVNSDIMHSTLEINNQKLSIAKTKTLELKSQDLKNIDAGFIEKNKFDLKIDKTIKKITIQDNKGEKVISYHQSQLAKVEIDSKKIENTNVIIEYDIAVHNQGEVAGYANEIIDYLPKGLSLNEEMKKVWSQMEDGSISTKVLSNQVILPKETKNVTLIVSKKITQENVGTIINKAKISKYSNESIVEDINMNDNESQADVIISIKTGNVILYLSLIIIIALMTAFSIYFIKKQVLQEKE